MPKSRKLRKPDEYVAKLNKQRPFINGRGTVTVAYNKESTNVATIMIYEDIGSDPWFGGGITAKDFADSLAEIPMGMDLDIRINSAGGIVWDGLAMKTMLDEWPGKVTVSIDGMAASTASWVGMGADEIRAPAHAQLFIHDAWGMVMGNSEDMRKQAEDLDKTSDQIAQIYSNRTGMSIAECRQMMQDATLMTGQEALDNGFIDRISDEEGDVVVTNFTKQQLDNMRSKLAALNQHRSQINDTMDRAAKIALLKNWGYTGDTKDVTDEWLDKAIERGRPKNGKKKNELFKFGEKEGDDDGEAGEADDLEDPPKSVVKKGGDGDDDADDGEDDEGEFSNRVKTMAKNAEKTMQRAELMIQQAEKREKDALQLSVTNRIKKVVEDSKVPAGQIDDWINDAMVAKNTEAFLTRLENLEPRRPGLQPLSIEVGESSSFDELTKMVNKLKEPQEYCSRNRIRGDLLLRTQIGNAAKELSAKLNKLKKYDPSTGVMIGPLRDMWDQYGAGSSMMTPMNAGNTMQPTLLRQVIMSEVMRAFRRRLVALEYFAHNFQTVPLEGTDLVVVPYYPLATIASTQFTYAAGYNVFGAVPNGTGQTLSKQIQVGGAGGVTNAGNAAGFTGTSIPGTAVPTGGGRLYQTLQFTAYEIRRQPWLDINKLTIMAGEQLALDVLNTIIAAWINQGNFGNAPFSGAPVLFDSTSLADLQVVANQSDWPDPMRACVLDSVYYGNLLKDPYLKAYLNIGSTDIIREARIGAVYGFEAVIQNPRIPTTGDAQLKGWISWPSAVLVATAPIQPAPGEAQRLVSWDIVADDQTGLAFLYKYWGDPNFSADAEIIECTFGSNVGELAALKRIVAAGN